MSSVLLTIKTDSDTREELKILAGELGVSVTDFVNMVVKQALRERRVGVDASESDELEPTPYLEKIMREAEVDLAANRNITTTNSKEEALAHLRSLCAD